MDHLGIIRCRPTARCNSDPRQTSGRAGRRRSVCHGGQLSEGMVGEEVVQGVPQHAARMLDGPFVILFEQHGADEASGGRFVGEDTDDMGATLGLVGQALDGVGAVHVVRWGVRKVMQANASASEASIKATSLGTVGRR